MNDKFLLHIDRTGYKNKESAKNEIALIKQRLQVDTEPEAVTLKVLMERIQKGCTISLGVMEGGKKAEHWKSQQIFAVDIDNDADGQIMDIKEALRICQENNLPPAFYYYSFSDTMLKPKYRLIFVMDEVVTEEPIRKVIIDTLIGLFDQADTSGANADRMFFGTDKEAIVCDLESRVSFEAILQIYEPPIIKEVVNTKTLTTYQDNEIDLEKLKHDFDFFSYLQQRNGSLKYNNSNNAMFRHCELCNHSNDLVYYHATNTFMCFSSGCGKGGSIIDYLMITEGLDSKEATKYFIYDICGIEKKEPRQTVTCKNGVFKKESFELKTYNALQLSEMDLPPTEFLVKDLIAEGLTILTAKSKSYKSWWCTQLCTCVAQGIPFLGFETKRCDSLYIDLEESEKGLKQRLNLQYRNEQMPEGFHIIFEIPNMDNGFVSELEGYLDKNPSIRLVVIDVYAKIKMQKKAGVNDYDADYNCLTVLKKIAEHRSIFLIIVSHNRKQVDEDDVFSNILGSTALIGSTDASIVIHRKKRTDKEFTISTTGRTIPTNDFKALFNLNTFRWELIGNADEVEEMRKRERYEKDKVIFTIKKLVDQGGGIYKGQIKDIILASKYLQNHIYEEPTTIGKSMKRYIDQLYEYDRIRTRVVSKGTASNIYEFTDTNPHIVA